MVIMSEKVNDFVAAVEAINDDELTIQEMHDAYANSDGLVADFDLKRLEYVVTRLQLVVRLVNNNRSDF